MAIKMIKKALLLVIIGATMVSCMTTKTMVGDYKTEIGNVCQPFFPQQFLYFFPLPHGQGSFLPGCLPFTTGWLLFMPATKSLVCKDGTLNDITV